MGRDGGGWAVQRRWVVQRGWVRGLAVCGKDKMVCAMRALLIACIKRQALQAGGRARRDS